MDDLGLKNETNEFAKAEDLCPPRPPNFQRNHQMSTCTTHGKGTTDKNVQNALEIMRPCSLSPACSEGNNMNNVAASTNIKQASRQKPCLIYLCLVPETYTHNILNFSWKASKSRPDLPKLTAEISMICHHSAAHGNRQRCKYIFITVDRRCVQLSQTMCAACEVASMNNFLC